MLAATMTGAHQPLEKGGGTIALRLTIAFTNNLRVQPLKDGRVKPENIDLDFVTLDAGELFFRNLKYDGDARPFEVAARGIGGTI
jgi:hypothetical protein